MRNSCCRIMVSLLVLISVAAGVEAQVKVGDTPALSFTAADGANVSLANLRGKMVLIDFWATWCGPCMAEADHMVAIHRQYKDQGLVMLGISLDSNKDKMMQVAREQGFAWPHYFDGLVWKNKISLEWGVRGIPATFLIGPDGRVLWTGHSAGIDGPLAKAMKEHPPVLVDPKVAQAALRELEQVEAALKRNDTAAAMKALARVSPDAVKDKDVAAKLEVVGKQAESAVAGLLAEVEQLAAKQDYAGAATKLREMSQWSGTPAARDASDRLRKLMTNGDAKAAFDAADKAAREQEKATRADAALASALKLQQEKRDEQAYAALKSIVSVFAGTAAAEQAAAALATYDQDPAFAKRMNEKAAEAKARGMLSMAANYRSAGRNDLARQRYEQVIKDFPGTPVAEEAKRELAKLPK